MKYRGLIIFLCLTGFMSQALAGRDNPSGFDRLPIDLCEMIFQYQDNTSSVRMSLVRMREMNRRSCWLLTQDLGQPFQEAKAIFVQMKKLKKSTNFKKIKREIRVFEQSYNEAKDRLGSREEIERFENYVTKMITPWLEELLSKIDHGFDFYYKNTKVKILTVISRSSFIPERMQDRAFSLIGRIQSPSTKPVGQIFFVFPMLGFQIK